MRGGEREITVYAEIFSGHTIPIHGDGLGIDFRTKEGRKTVIMHLYIYLNKQINHQP